ncbi:MAG: hypothetical protein ACR2QU_02920, partial [Gammaproteobacteria bacterium]
LHQTIIVVAGVWLSKLALGPVLEPVTLILATIAGCAGIMFFVERWLPWLGSGIGLKAAPRQPDRRRASSKLVGERV